MKKTWPKTLGDRDRTTQYDAYVKPLSAEEKIIHTQLAHSKTQKEINKAIINIEHAITCYFKAHYGAKEVIGKLDDMRFQLKDLQEEIMKLTMNALPYKDLDGEREQEKLFMEPINKMSLKTLAYIGLILANILIFLSGYLFDMPWLYVVGIFASFGSILYWYAPWSKRMERTLPLSKKVGPKI